MFVTVDGRNTAPVDRYLESQVPYFSRQKLLVLEVKLPKKIGHLAFQVGYPPGSRGIQTLLTNQQKHPSAASDPPKKPTEIWGPLGGSSQLVSG